MGELRFSGAEVMLKIAGERWEALGVQGSILATAARIGPYVDELAAAGYPIHHIPLRGSLGFLWRLSRLIRSDGYDVVHVHTERASLWLCLTARLSGALAVRTVHNSFGFGGALRMRRTMQRWLARRAGTRFISVGKSVHQNEQRRFCNPSQIIPNWLDIERYSPPTTDQRERGRRRFGFSDDDIVIVSVGNCSTVKNHSELIRAIAAHGEKLRLLHVGEEEGTHPERRLAKGLGIADACVFLGRVDPQEALHAADMFAMPSLFEGLGIATAEALATGLPALLTDVPGSRDFRDLDVAITWSATDADSLRRGLDKALHTHVRSADAAQGRRQHEHIARAYSPEVGIQAYTTVYRLGA